MSGNIGRIGFFRYGFDKRLLLTFGFPGVIFTLAGSLLVHYFSQPFLKLTLGIFLIFYVSVSLYKSGISFKSSWKNSVIGGSLSGFFAGLIGTGGVLRAAF